MKKVICTLGGDGHEVLVKCNIPRIEKYAKKFGWNTFYQWESMDRSKHARFTKLHIVSKLFDEGYDVVLFLDADTIILNFDENIADELVDNKWIYLAYDMCNENRKYPNTGVFMVKNCPIARKFIEEAKLDRKKEIHNFADQGIMIQLLGWVQPKEGGIDTIVFGKSTKYSDGLQVLPRKWNYLYKSNIKIDKYNILHYAGVKFDKKIKDFKKFKIDFVLKNGDLDEIFTVLEGHKSDINEHLKDLKYLSSKCKTVTEFGVRSGLSTVALLCGKPEKLTSYDINDPKCDIKRYKMLAKKNGTDFVFIKGNSLKVNIEKTDMLFIDSYHTYAQLKSELEQHAQFINKWIALHDTEMFGDCGKDNKKPGLRKAISEFLEKNKEWKIVVNKKNNNGFMVIEKWK